MTKFQVMAVACCVLLNLNDGYDLVAVAFAAPVLSSEWRLDPSQLGLVFAAGGFGMMIGAFFLGPLADYKGRRFVVLLGLILGCIGMFLAAHSPSMSTLIAARVITGIGVGAMISSMNTLVAEYSSDKSRGMCIALMHVAYPVGVTLGGLMATSITSNWGWQGVFVFGGMLSLILLPVAYFFLPESMEYHLATGKSDALEKVNDILRRMQRPTLDSLPEVAADSGISKDIGFRRLLRHDLLLPNMLMPIAFFSVMMNLYVMLQWTPKFMVDLGYSNEQGYSASVVMSLFNALGMLLFGFLASHFGVKKVEQVLSVLATIAMLLLGLVASAVPFEPLMAFYALHALTSAGLLVGLFTLCSRVYPPAARAAGTSLSIGVARTATFVGPAMAGFLIADIGASGIMMLMAIPLLVPFIVLSSIAQRKDWASAYKAR